VGSNGRELQGFEEAKKGGLVKPKVLEADEGGHGDGAPAHPQGVVVGVRGGELGEVPPITDKSREEGRMGEEKKVSRSVRPPVPS
jgi:hypothetical protein